MCRNVWECAQVVLLLVLLFPGMCGNVWECSIVGGVSPSKHYSKEDLEKYEDLVESTQVIFNPLKTSENDRPQTTAKYKEFLKELQES